tara:strand:- start:1465 stop:2079 length:615 start_codon:yes stop_codon:yes gene_type:complete
MISIEGGIGAGKTSVLRKLAERLGERTLVVEEPVADWIRLGLLRRSAQRPLPFQMAVLTSLVSVHGRALRGAQGRLLVTERSAKSNREVFARANLTSDALDFYDYTYGELRKLEPDLFERHHPHVFLAVPVDTLMDRIRSRGRAEEVDLSVDYMRRIEDAHHQWMQRLDADDVIVVDGTAPTDCVADAIVAELVARRLLGAATT